ncbi:EAL and HDOD domain-containing protein [Dechloromonas sp. HYN0024]|uniref:EAL and HDOD domain-containing protein n=1 Tax=Dechloromonas sp. HYN0024 TaxID=2231055 RepID=UPI000E43AF03|nr:HDOD domain-containing protein [Dechloromonas sp. HYN0024]AXS79296.1 HDOD domain-containing protein [Dechloromonas sp. HYN0024]
MFGFIKRMLGLGGGKSSTATAERPSALVQPAAVPAKAPPFPGRSAPPVVLQRDEIIDAKTRIAGYRFSARRPDAAEKPDPASTLDVLAANNVAGFAERRMALIPLSVADWQRQDYTPLIGPHTTFLFALPDNEALADGWGEVAAAIHQAGAKIALAGGDILTHRAAILAHADCLLLDFSAFSLATLEKLINSLRQEKPALEFMAEKVSKWPEYRYCVSRGMAYCLGSFTTEQDEEQQVTEIGESRLILIEMLNQLRKEAELADIAQVAKRDPGVLVKLMSMANSPIMGLTQKVASIDQAIMVLGRERLYRWLSIGMFRAGAASPRDEVLLELALARARFLEALGQEKYNKAECDELFLLGLLSLLDILLGVPMRTVVDKISLSPALLDALLNSGGPLARYLMLSVAVEKGHVENVSRLAEQLGYSLDTVKAASLEALGWAEESVHLSE